jgi:hypothetical protein
MTRRRPRKPYDPADNARKGYDLALACLRERRVRARALAPRNETERRWAAEGPVPEAKLESLTPANENGQAQEVPFG